MSFESTTTGTTRSLRYDHFKVLVSDISAFGGKCPLCGTPLQANVAHECSNGKPIVEGEGTPVIDATAEHPAVFRKGRKLVAGRKRGAWKGCKK